MAIQPPHTISRNSKFYIFFFPWPTLARIVERYQLFLEEIRPRDTRRNGRAPRKSVAREFDERPRVSLEGLSSVPKDSACSQFVGRRTDDGKRAIRPDTALLSPLLFFTPVSRLRFIARPKEHEDASENFGEEFVNGFSLRTDSSPTFFLLSSFLFHCYSTLRPTVLRPRGNKLLDAHSRHVFTLSCLPGLRCPGILANNLPCFRLPLLLHPFRRPFGTVRLRRFAPFPFYSFISFLSIQTFK